MNALYIDIYKDQMLPIELFGRQVLYTKHPIAREEVPEGWCCYDLCGTDRKPNRSLKLTDAALIYHTGTVLSPRPLKRSTTLERKVTDLFFPNAEPLTLAEFCRKQNLPCPQDPRKYVLRPASPEEAGLFYALPPERDEALGAIGHVRIDFGGGGSNFHHSWWPRGPEELNTQEFRDELGSVVDELRRSVLKDLSSMRRYCWGHGGEIKGGVCCQNYGYVVETDRCLYRLRCNPAQGDYHAYLGCFDKQAQKQIIGRVTFAGGVSKDFTDPQKYLRTLREELPYHPTTGFRYETLTDDPEIRKAVDDMLYDLYGEENPRPLEDYGSSGMMGGMSL
ncbi:LPD28 domain-containing protein [uncultured Oscillibacter sp.]|uniref:LPD28 domain-containing protein n=1 Tax=uncultured Oscillibacter sp. TaxID=876091 RepID=UPI0025D21ADB|nr:LPD28 domain-containing protein [uncultured Oscillibacter sp.]